MILSARNKEKLAKVGLLFLFPRHFVGCLGSAPASMIHNAPRYETSVGASPEAHWSVHSCCQRSALCFVLYFLGFLGISRKRFICCPSMSPSWSNTHLHLTSLRFPLSPNRLTTTTAATQNRTSKQAGDPVALTKACSEAQGRGCRALRHNFPRPTCHLSPAR